MSVLAKEARRRRYNDALSNLRGLLNLTDRDVVIVSDDGSSYIVLPPSADAATGRALVASVTARIGAAPPRVVWPPQVATARGVIVDHDVADLLHVACVHTGAPRETCAVYVEDARNVFYTGYDEHEAGHKYDMADPDVVGTYGLQRVRMARNSASHQSAGT